MDMVLSFRRMVVWAFACHVLICIIQIGESSSISNDFIGNSENNSTEPIQRRLSKDMFKNLNMTSSNQQKRSAGKVEIIEAGSSLRSRGDSRVLKRGPPSSSAGAPGKSGFSIKTRGGPSPTYDGQVPFETASGIPLVSIPGSSMPPPVYSFNDNSAPSPSGFTGGSYGSPGPSVVTYRPITGGGGGFVSSTPMPEIIFPPMTVSPGPMPIRPPTGTSIPIIGGGGRPSPGGSVLPPSPPPEDIFPPAPPPDDEFEIGVGRRLKISSGAGASGSDAGDSKVRTRLVSPKSPTYSRFTSSEVSRTPSSLTSFEKLRAGVGKRERLRDKVREFHTSAVGEQPVSAEEIVVEDPNVITDFVFSDIKCHKSRHSEYFGATIHMKSGFHLPYIRDRPQDPLTSDDCKLDLVEGTRGSYHMTVSDLRGCGVEQCGESMCLTMVFPRVPMLALADDEVTTIKCAPQKSTMSDTKSISFAGDSMETRRSSSTVEGGIQEFVAEVGVFRQNPGATNGLFVKRVNSGGVVQLGEPLQLRSVVRGTDGWKSSKLTDVKVWRMRDNLSTKLDNLDPNDASEVITLVDQHGCRNDEYTVIADDHPIRDPRNDLVHHFTFKAFLFRGQRVNEPLIVTAKVHACQEGQDCITSCGFSGRKKRSPVELHNSSSIITDYDSKLALRVVGLKDHPSSIQDDDFAFDYIGTASNRTGTESGNMLTCNEKMFATGLGGGCVMLLICGLALALYTFIKQGRSLPQTNSSKESAPPASASNYRYMPPPGRPSYQKPLPPPPTSETPTYTAPPPNPLSNQQPKVQQPSSQSSSKDDSIYKVEKLLKELVKNNNNHSNDSANVRKSVKQNKGARKEFPSEYARIGEANSSSACTSSEDLHKRSKDGLYIVYCYENDKKRKAIPTMSAPASTKVRRKSSNQVTPSPDDTDDYCDHEDFLQDLQDDDSEQMASQTDDPTDESDEYGDIRNQGSRNVHISSKRPNSRPCNITLNQVVRRTVRDVKKKSKQNNMLANGSSRNKGNLRQKLSSVYREGYFNGFRGVVSSVGGKGGSFPLRYKKSPSIGSIPEEILNIRGGYDGHRRGKKINFTVRDSSSHKNRPPILQQHAKQYTAEGVASETVISDMDSAYSGSGSNCSKLTEAYDMKRNGGGSRSSSGGYPDLHRVNQNRTDVQRQLINAYMAKQDLRRTNSSPNNGENSSGVGVSLGSPPLSLGETKTTHFVTRDDSATKILIVPETHV